MVVVEEIERFHPCRVVETLIAVEPVLIHLDVAMHHQFEEIGEEVHLRAHGFHGIIQSGIGIILEVEFPVDVTPPHHVFRHGSRSGEGNLSPCGDVVGIRLGSLLFALVSARLRLGSNIQDHTYGEQDEYYASHIEKFPFYLVLIHDDLHGLRQFSRDTVGSGGGDICDIESFVTREFPERIFLAF